MTTKPLFHLAVVHAHDGKVAQIPGGGPLEADLVELITAHVLSRGVGFFKTTKHVEKDIKDGVRAALMSLKEQTKFIV